MIVSPSVPVGPCLCGSLLGFRYLDLAANHGRNHASDPLFYDQRRAEFLLATFRPKMRPVDRVRQPGSDEQSITGTAHATFEHITRATGLQILFTFSGCFICWQETHL